MAPGQRGEAGDELVLRDLLLLWLWGLGFGV